MAAAHLHFVFNSSFWPCDIELGTCGLVISSAIFFHLFTLHDLRIVLAATEPNSLLYIIIGSVAGVAVIIITAVVIALVWKKGTASEINNAPL